LLGFASLTPTYTGCSRTRTNAYKYPLSVYPLPKHLDEKVARLQLKRLDARLTVLAERQMAYIGVPMEKPYKAGTIE
jgi:adenosylhomocysteinase